MIDFLQGAFVFLGTLAILWIVNEAANRGHWF